VITPEGAALPASAPDEEDIGALHANAVRNTAAARSTIGRAT